MPQTIIGHIMERLAGEDEPVKGWTIWDAHVRGLIGVPVAEKQGRKYKEFLQCLDTLVDAGHLERVKPTDLKKGERPSKARSLYRVTKTGQVWWEDGGGMDEHLEPLEKNTSSSVKMKAGYWVGRPIHKLLGRPPVETQKDIDRHLQSGRLGILYYDPRKGRPEVRYVSTTPAEELFSVADEE